MVSASHDALSADNGGGLAGLCLNRTLRSPQQPAYRWFDEGAGRWRDITWGELAIDLARWQTALAEEGLPGGARVAMMIRNGPTWVLFDQAALGLGLVTVPLYVDDRPESVAYILADAGVSLLLVDSIDQWRAIEPACADCESLARVVVIDGLDSPEEGARVLPVGRWLSRGEVRPFRDQVADPQQLATIVYTSGTTGRSKGVMLSHANIRANVVAALGRVAAYPGDVFLSFLPLSHMLERTAGYYLPMMAGATVAYARNAAVLADDLLAVRPTVLVSVPRIFERVFQRIRNRLRTGKPLARHLFELAVAVGWGRFEHRQGRSHWRLSALAWPLLDALVARKVRARLGGRLRLAVCGGAPLGPAIARTFIGLGVPIVHGYGLTEAAPAVSVNALEDNLPASVGAPLAGVEVRIGAGDELLVRGANVMQGYWKNPQATATAIDAEGWLHTGDRAHLDGSNRITITGRLKEIIVMANGEKVPPADLELAILTDPLFEQVMVIGEGRPFLGAIVVLNGEEWARLAAAAGFEPGGLAERSVERAALRRMGESLHAMPGYARVRRAVLSLDPWTIENGLLTPTLKTRRARVMERFADDVERVYRGH